jgi:hypothetical protein
MPASRKKRSPGPKQDTRPEPTVILIPDDAEDRPALAPLIDGGLLPGDAVFVEDPERWRSHRILKPNAAMLAAARQIPALSMGRARLERGVVAEAIGSVIEAAPEAINAPLREVGVASDVLHAEMRTVIRDALVEHFTTHGIPINLPVSDRPGAA